MTVKFETLPDRMRFLEDSVVVFDSDLAPLQLAPSGEEIIVSTTVTFPDLMKGDSYAYARGTIGADLYRSCMSFLTLGPQEWGPSVSNPDSGRTLAESVLGTVPSGVDSLYVLAKVTRTTNPSQINGNTIPVLPSSGDWTVCAGGSLPLEFLWPLSRQIDVRLRTDASGDPVYNGDGSRDIVLERRQSVITTLYTYWRGGNDPTNSGWTYGGTAGAYGHIVAQLDTKGPSFTPGTGADMQRGQSNACSLTDTTDYSSVYSLDLRIIPVATLNTPVNSVTDNKVILYLGMDTDGATTSRVFDVLLEHPTRYIYAAVGATNNLGSGSTTITGVTIGGVTATPLVTANRSAPEVDGGIWVAAVPTGTSVTVVVSTSNSGYSSIAIALWAGYNLVAPTVPDATISSQTVYGTTVGSSLVTVADGWAIGFAMDRDFSGLTNIVQGFQNMDFPEGISLAYWCANSKTDGTTKLVRAETNTASSTGTSTRATGLRWFAASFH